MYFVYLQSIGYQVTEDATIILFWDKTNVCLLVFSSQINIWDSFSNTFRIVSSYTVAYFKKSDL